MTSKMRRTGPTLSLVPEAPDRDALAQDSAAPESRLPDRLDWSSLMTQAQGGDRDAYRRLLEAITPYLRSLAARRIGNRGDVEDTVQDILLTVHTVRRSYDPARPFGPWLVTIANRRIVDWLRQRGRSSAHETSFEPEHETLQASSANLQEEAVDARVLREAVGRLPAGQRDAIRMLKLEEMSLKEAAQASGVSVAALKVATHRALKKLREMINQPEGRT
ncbi:MAG: sigma-70 family RNA polymerase sigma factor [Burkholderiaceae bacterium]|nr:MAG: sigma-70 family RNA polymerase sigma factor [Burkholderiaceae bacterium]